MFLRRTFSRFSSGTANSSSNHNSGERGIRASSVVSDIGSISPVKRPLNVVQLTPLWEYIIRTRRMPDDLNLAEVFDEFQERLRDPEWQVRQHALRVLVDLLLVMGDEADVYFGPLIPPLIENLGHDAPAIRKASLDALRIYIANTLMPETVMLEILDTGLERQAATFSGARYTIGVILSIPSLIQPVLLTPKRSFILRSVFNVLEKKMLQIQYQEIVLKVLLKIKDMIGEREFNGSLPVLMKRDFDLLCKVYHLPSPDSNGVQGKTWSSKSHDKPQEKKENFEKRTRSCDHLKIDSTSSTKEVNFDVLHESFQRIFSPEENANTKNADEEASFVKIDSESDFDASVPHTPQSPKKSHKKSSKASKESSPEDFDFKILKDNSVQITDPLTKRSFSAKSTPRNAMEVLKNRPQSHTTAQMGTDDDHGKVIIETEIKLNKDTAVMMRIFETPAENSQTEDLEFELDIDGLDESTQKEVNVNIIKPADDENNDSDDSVRTPKRVTFGGEVVKLRTPDSDNAASSTASSSHDTQFNEMVSERLLQTTGQNKSPIDRPLQIQIPEQPAIITIPPTSSSDNSGSPKVSKRNSTTAIDKSFPKHNAREVQMLHNLARSPTMSPTRGSPSPPPIQRVSSPRDNARDSTDNTDSSSPENRNASWESLGIVSPNSLRNLRSGDYRLRAQGYTKLESALKSFENLAQVQSYLPSLLKTLLSFETNPDIVEQKQRIVTNLISRLPLENLENNFGRIMTGLCRQGGPGSNVVAKSLMQRLPTAAIVLRLLSEEFLRDRTSKFKENALQMVMFALITFPSTYFDVHTCVSRASVMALDRKKRVRQAALDVLAILGQISGSPRVVIDGAAETVKYKNDGDFFVMAVKARLARKLLPHVTPDGTVEYALKLPRSKWQHATNCFGADVDWIYAGSGSVSPPSIGRRRDDSLYSGLHSRYSRSFPDLNRTTIMQAERSRKTKLPMTTRFPDVRTEHRVVRNPYATYPKKIKSIRLMETESFSVESSTQESDFAASNYGSSTAFDVASASISMKTEQSTPSSKLLKGILVKSGPDGPPSSSSRPASQTKPVDQPDAPTGYESEVSSILGADNAQDDSDDSTATRIIEKSNLFQHLQNDRPKSGKSSHVETEQRPVTPKTPQKTETTFTQLETVEAESDKIKEKSNAKNDMSAPEEIRLLYSRERPKSSGIVMHENETIIITRPKTTGASPNLERRELKLTLEIEPVDFITIRTPPKTPERLSLTFDTLASFSPEPLMLPNEPIPLPPPSSKPLQALTGSEEPIVEHPVSPVSRSPTRSPTRSSTKSPVPNFEETPIVQKTEPKPMIPHFKTPAPQQGSDSTYESTTDTEQKKPPKHKKKDKSPSSTKSKGERPRDLIVNCFLKLQSPNWEEVMEGLESFVFLIKHHAELVEANLHLMTIELSKQIRNLRSQVARAACQAAGQLFQTHRRSIEPEAEELTTALLNRTSDTNKFLRADAFRALEAMCDNLPVAKVIHLLAYKGATHHNGLVKCAAAKLLAKLVDKIGGEKVFSLSKDTREKLILTSANLLTEGSLETRSYAKEIFRLLNVGNPNAAKVFLDVIPPRIYRSIEKTLKSLFIF